MPIETDALIIGAGPCGLFQVFELGLLDIRAHVVDTMATVGGQCAELYPDKPIYDIPAYPVIGARELVERLMEQIEPFHATFHLDQEVQELERMDAEWFRVATSAGTVFHARSVIIAAGVGSFQPRRMRLQGTDRFEGSQIHYKVRDSEDFSGEDLLVLGGGDSALDWALALCERARSLTLIHRRADYRAQPASVSKMEELCAAGKMQAHQGQLVALVTEGDRLAGVQYQDLAGERHPLTVTQVLAFWGLSPKLGPIAQWGLNLEKNQIPVTTDTFQTSEEGMYAIGDIGTYPGKKKLILSGFHEAALAAFEIRHRLHPEEKIRLQYTTTSTVMHERLGLKDG